MEAVWRIEMLGWLRATHSDLSISKFQTQRTACLFAYLALNNHRTFPREQLVEIVWPGDDPEQTRDRLNQALSWLRRHLETNGIPAGSVLISDRVQAGLSTTATVTDVQTFLALVRQAEKATDSHQKMKLLAEGVAIFKGEFLPGMHEEWIENERMHLSETLSRSLKQLIDLHEHAGDLEGAITFARRAIVNDNLDEENHFALIRLLGLTGKTALALKQFADLERILVDDLGVTPSAATLSLIDQIRGRTLPGPSADIALNLPEAPPKEKKGSSRVAGGVAKPLSRFYGREEELNQIGRAFANADRRLVTLTGSGGCGKTRLAIEYGHKVGPDIEQAVWFVALAEVTDVKYIAPNVLKALQIENHVSRPILETLSDELNKWKDCLIVLDDFDQLVPQAKWLHELLGRVPGLRLLVTSRQKLNIEGEQEVQVPTLPVPPAAAPVGEVLSCPAVQIFVDRAAAVRTGFELTEDNAEAVRAVCGQLEGLPLAIELAAAWAQTYTPTEMLQELNHRFDLLVSRRRDISPRHRTLRAAVEYSYRLLPSDLQHLFAQLSVFRGGWSVEAAEEVCGEADLREKLTALRDRSLIIAEEVADSSFRTIRYRMLETLREYVAEQLTGDEKAVLRGAHSEYFLRFVKQAEPHLRGRAQAQWFSNMALDFANVQSALRWYAEHGNVVDGLELATRLLPFWEVRGPASEGRQWLTQLLEMPGEVSPVVRARALSALGSLTWMQTDFDAAGVAHAKALEIYRELGDRHAIADSLYHLGIVALRVGEHEQSSALLRQSLEISEELNDRPGIARILLNLGNIGMDLGRSQEGRHYYERSLVIEQELRNTQRVAAAMNNLGNLAFLQGQYTLATFYLEEAIRAERTIGSRSGSAAPVANLARIARRRGEYARAAQLLLWSLNIFIEFGNRFFLRLGLVELSALLSNYGRYAEAAMALEAAEGITRAIGIPVSPSERSFHDDARRLLEENLGEEERAAASSFAQILPWEQLMLKVMEIAKDLESPTAQHLPALP